MIKISISLVLVLLVVTPANAIEGRVQSPTRQEVDRGMGLSSKGDVVRGQRDTVGFVVTREQAEDVISEALALEREMIIERDRELGTSPEHGFLGGICPHDDHLYAGRAYVHLTERITAPRIVLVGVFHAARLWDLEDVLVFDSFQNWHGPWGPVPVDGLREQVLERMDPRSFIVDNAMHSREHSLEAIVPFLQHKNRDVSIIPILVPYARWGRIQELADELAGALGQIIRENNWVLGRDVAIVVSSDAVHYGPDFEHAPFGTDAAGYQRGVDRDIWLAETYLGGELRPSKLQSLLATLVDQEDPQSYKVPWCGRFSVPFGLEVLRKVAEESGFQTPEGHLLRYATSLSEPELPVSLETKNGGLGVTAPSNLHHWVGYATVGVMPGQNKDRPGPGG